MTTMTLAIGRTFDGVAAWMRDLRVTYARKAAERAEYNRIMDELRRLDRREMVDLGICPHDFHDIARGTYRR